jgi:hypothetical protein
MVMDTLAAPVSPASCLTDESEDSSEPPNGPPRSSFSSDRDALMEQLDSDMHESWHDGHRRPPVSWRGE